MLSVLIVEADPVLGRRWADCMAQSRLRPVIARDLSEAQEALRSDTFGVIVIDLAPTGQGAFGVADFALYRQPEARVIFLTASDDIAGPALFWQFSNASAILRADTPPDDLAAIVEYHAAAR